MWNYFEYGRGFNRHSFVFQSISPNELLILGGERDSQPMGDGLIINTENLTHQQIVKPSKRSAKFKSLGNQAAYIED